MIEEKIQTWMQRRGGVSCPVCGSDEEWDFGRVEVVVTLPEQSLDSGIGSLTATSFSGGNVGAAMQKALENLQKASRGTSNKVVKLPCWDCGYVLFLDGRKVL